MRGVRPACPVTGTPTFTLDSIDVSRLNTGCMPDTLFHHADY
jgi:hypothetical protein